MRKIVNVVFAIGNWFWIPFVCWKIYGWFAPEVGFDLPELSYWNIFAIRMLLGVFNSDIGLAILLSYKPDSEKEGTKDIKGVIMFVTFAVALLADYLVKIILF